MYWSFPNLYLQSQLPPELWTHISTWNLPSGQLSCSKATSPKLSLSPSPHTPAPPPLSLVGQWHTHSTSCPQSEKSVFISPLSTVAYTCTWEMCNYNSLHDQINKIFQWLSYAGLPRLIFGPKAWTRAKVLKLRAREAVPCWGKMFFICVSR